MTSPACGRQLSLPTEALAVRAALNGQELH